MAKEKRKVVGKDSYGNDVFEGQVPVRDAHGNTVYEDADARSGAAHLKDKHPEGRFTGRRDAHGNEIWETPGKAKKEDEAAA